MGGIHQYMQAGITQGGIHIIIIGPRLALILPPDGWPPYIIVAAAIHLPSPCLLLRSGYKGWKRSPTRQSRYGDGALRVYAPERFNVQAGAACKCPSENAATPSPALTYSFSRQIRYFQLAHFGGPLFHPMIGCIITKLTSQPHT